MYKLNDFLQILEQEAPLSLSFECIKQGDYDNSGIIINSGKDVSKVLFSLDLSNEAVKNAILFKADTIVTHHPAIYLPIKNLSVEDPITSPVLNAVKEGINVISMHLNLDTAKRGIDYYLAQNLGAKEQEIITDMGNSCGYGRVFIIKEIPLDEFVDKVEKDFGTKNVVKYGNRKVKKVASFCGAGSSYAEKTLLKNFDFDTVVTSDMPHHVIKELIEKEKNVVLLPHYVAEEYGFNKFYQNVSNSVKDVYLTYFLDQRFK